ncbi:MAG: PssD/Cps14F family polysaccharide biosynthesis glycosyltransferase [Clostridia bacterium]
MKKVIFVSSSGGHFAELLRLEELFSQYEYMLVTEDTKLTRTYVDKYNIKYLKYGSRHYFLKYIFVFLTNVFKCIKIVMSFKPDTIVTTGAHTGGIMCIIAKIFRHSRIIYIESLAKTKGLSVTGKNVYPFADKFYVQWESLALKYKKAEYLGRLI